MALKENLSQLQEILTAFNNKALTREEFDSKVKRLIGVIIKIEQRQVDAIQALEQKHEALLKLVGEQHNLSISELKGQVDEVFVGDRLNEIDTRIDDRLSLVRDGNPGIDGVGIKGDRGDVGPEGKPPEGLIERFEELEGENKKLRESIKTAAKQQSSKSMGRVKVPMTARINLTSQVDGSQRTFALGRKDVTAVYGIFSSQFPFTMDNADFALVGTNIEFRGNMPTLESGQTLVALVETLFYP